MFWLLVNATIEFRTCLSSLVRTGLAQYKMGVNKLTFYDLKERQAGRKSSVSESGHTQIGLAVIETHPIQYHAPVYRHLQSNLGIEVAVVYGSDFSVTG